jgi:hypothetical protein
MKSKLQIVAEHFSVNSEAMAQKLHYRGISRLGKSADEIIALYEKATEKPEYLWNIVYHDEEQTRLCKWGSDEILVINEPVDKVWKTISSVIQAYYNGRIKGA